MLIYYSNVQTKFLTVFKISNITSENTYLFQVINFENCEKMHF